MKYCDQMRFASTGPIMQQNATAVRSPPRPTPGELTALAQTLSLVLRGPLRGEARRGVERREREGKGRRGARREGNGRRG